MWPNTSDNKCFLSKSRKNIRERQPPLSPFRKVMIKCFYSPAPIFGSCRGAWLGQPRKCYINCRKYNLHIMMEAIKLSHYCPGLHIYDTPDVEANKLKFFSSYTFSRGLLRLHTHLQLYGASRAMAANCVFILTYHLAIAQRTIPM